MVVVEPPPSYSDSSRGIVTGAGFQHVGLQERKVTGIIPPPGRFTIAQQFCQYRGDLFEAGDVRRGYRATGADIRWIGTLVDPKSMAY